MGPAGAGFRANALGDIKVYVELGHTEAIKEAVEAGLGISCLSLLATRRARRSGALVALDTPFLDLRRTFYLLVHGEKYRTALLRRFIAFCQEQTLEDAANAPIT